MSTSPIRPSGQPAPVSPELQQWADLVAFLGELLGPQVEVLLHDPHDFRHSIVAIANSHISGRSVGGPATDLVLRLWQSRQHESTSHLVNYDGQDPSGRPLRSSTYFIRGAQGQVIGLLCFNFDDAPLTTALESLTAYLTGINARVPNAPSSTLPAQERLSASFDELAEERIRELANATGVDPARLSIPERLDFVRAIEDEGLFLVKGAVGLVATALGVSEPTAYRYLRQVRSENLQSRSLT